MNEGTSEPLRHAAVAISYMLVGGILASRVRARRAPTCAHVRSAPILSPHTELLGPVRSTQIPAPHVADELVKLVKRAVLALGVDGCLADVLRYRSPLGAQIYAFSRGSTVGRRLRGDMEDVSGTKSRYNPDESLSTRELLVWNRLTVAGGGWCAYVNVDREDSLHTQYVYIERARTPKVTDMFVTAGFSI